MTLDNIPRGPRTGADNSRRAATTREPVSNRNEDDGNGSDFMRGLGSGLEEFPAMIDLGQGVVQNLFGFDDAAKANFKEAINTIDTVKQKYGETDHDAWAGVHSLGDFADYIQYNAGRMAPDAVAAITSGGLGALAEGAGKIALKKVAISKAENLLMKTAMKVGSKVGGREAGAIAYGAARESGSNWKQDMITHHGNTDLTNPFTDALLGTVSGATEAFSPVSMIGKGSGGNVFMRALKGAGKEALQEETQTALSVASDVNNDKELDFNTELKNRTPDSLILGGVMGGMAGPVGKNTDNGTADIAENAYRKAGVIDKLIRPISSRLSEIDPQLTNILRRNQFDRENQTQQHIDVSDRYHEKLDALTKSQQREWHRAGLNRDPLAQYKLAQKYGFGDEYAAMRSTLNELNAMDKDAGIDMGHDPGFTPMAAKNSDALVKMRETLGLKYVSNFARSLARIKQETGITDSSSTDIAGTQATRDFMDIGDMETPDARAIMKAARHYVMQAEPGDSKAAILRSLMKDPKDAMRDYITRVNHQIYDARLQGGIPTEISNKQEELNGLASLAQNQITPAIQQRMTTLQQEINQYHQDADIAGRSIPGYINQGIDQKTGEHTTMAPEQLDEVTSIMKSYTEQKGTHGWLDTYKKLELIDTLGSPFSAVTQLKDIGFSGYANGLWNTLTSMGGKNRISKEDIGINADRVSAEISQDNVGGFLNKLLDYTGFKALDGWGKSTFITAQAKRLRNSASARKRIDGMFSKQTAEKVKQEFADYTPGKELSADAKFALYSKLLDFQPVDMSEMPQKYLDSGNGRIFYLLKTFSIKQLDIIRNESFSRMASKDPKVKAEGVKNLIHLGLILGISGAGIDQLKDWIKADGDETKMKTFKDSVIDNLLQMVFLSRYTLSNYDSPTAIIGQMLPAHKLPSAMARDADSLKSGTINEKGFKSVKSIPVIGELYSAGYGYDAHRRDTLQSRSHKAALKMKNNSPRTKAIYKAYNKPISQMTKAINQLKKYRPNDPRIQQLQDKKEELYNALETKLQEEINGQ